MKIKINLLVLFTIIMLFSNVVFADENIKINCNINNNNIMCELLGTSTDYEVVAIESSINTSSNIKLISMKNDSLWNGDASNNLLSLYGIGTGSVKEFKIGTLNFEIINDNYEYGKIALNQIRFADSTYKWHNLKDVSTSFDVNYVKDSSSNDWNRVLIIVVLLIIFVLCFSIVIYCIVKLKKNDYKFKYLIKNKLIISFVILLIIFIIFLILLLNNSSEKAYLYYDCTDYNTEEVRCEIYGYSNYKIEAIEGSFENNTDIDGKFKVVSDWQGEIDKNNISLIAYNNMQNKFKITDLFISNYKNSSNKIKISNIVFIDSFHKEHKLNDFVIKIKEEK